MRSYVVAAYVLAFLSAGLPTFGTPLPLAVLNNITPAGASTSVTASTQTGLSFSKSVAHKRDIPIVLPTSTTASQPTGTPSTGPSPAAPAVPPVAHIPQMPPSGPFSHRARALPVGAPPSTSATPGQPPAPSSPASPPVAPPNVPVPRDTVPSATVPPATVVSSTPSSGVVAGNPHLPVGPSFAKDNRRQAPALSSTGAPGAPVNPTVGPSSKVGAPAIPAVKRAAGNAAMDSQGTAAVNVSANDTGSGSTTMNGNTGADSPDSDDSDSDTTSDCGCEDSLFNVPSESTLGQSSDTADSPANPGNTGATGSGTDSDNTTGTGGLSLAQDNLLPSDDNASESQPQNPPTIGNTGNSANGTLNRLFGSSHSATPGDVPQATPGVPTLGTSQISDGFATAPEAPTSTSTGSGDNANTVDVSSVLGGTGDDAPSAGLTPPQTPAAPSTGTDDDNSSSGNIDNGAEIDLGLGSGDDTDSGAENDGSGSPSTFPTVPGMSDTPDVQPPSTSPTAGAPGINSPVDLTRLAGNSATGGNNALGGPDNGDTSSPSDTPSSGTGVPRPGVPAISVPAGDNSPTVPAGSPSAGVPPVGLPILGAPGVSPSGDTPSTGVPAPGGESTDSNGSTTAVAASNAALRTATTGNSLGQGGPCGLLV